MILFNPPFMDSAAESPLETAVRDPGYRTLRAFMAEAKAHLAVRGRVCLAFSDVGNVDLLEQLLRTHGFAHKTIRERQDRLRFFVLELRPI